LIELWKGLGLLLNRFISPLFLSAIYYAGLTPLALIRRFFGEGDALRLKKPSESNFNTINQDFSLEQFDDLW
jgi:hypothetical protein